MQWLAPETPEGSLNLLCTILLMAGVFYNYFKCVLTDPGKVPSDWVRIETLCFGSFIY